MNFNFSVDNQTDLNITFMDCTFLMPRISEDVEVHMYGYSCDITC